MNILAIGGGDKTEAIRSTLNSLPDEGTRVLLIPSACSIRGAYDRKVSSLQKYFAEFGVATSVLHEFDEAPTKTRIEHELGRASMLYTIGGNAPHMMQTLESHGTDSAIFNAIRGGKTHAGTSAGALLPFRLMHSNVSARPSKEEWDFQFLEGLGLLPGVLAVHANQHDNTPNGPRPDSRLEHLVANFPLAAEFGLALDNGAAIRLGTNPAIFRATKESRAYLIQPAELEATVWPLEDTAELPDFS
ncbi:hypothetical protein BH09PAT4_BH09PAT4_02250 [soil metagenome]